MLSQHDLLQDDPSSQAFDCQFCIIGAGAAGLYLATRLAAQNRSVVLVEAGDRQCVDSRAVGMPAMFSSAEYPGATLGRFFGLGGSTARWGGLLIPHSEFDLREQKSDQFDPWRFVVDTVAARADAVLHHLGLASSDFSAFAVKHLSVSEELATNGLATLAAKFMPLTGRNFAFLLPRVEVAAGHLRLILNAVVDRCETIPCSTGRARISQVSAVARNGRRVVISAEQVVITAGAIESARILLELNSAHRSPITGEAEVGMNLSDHLSCRIADVPLEACGWVAKTFGPRFANGTMRTFRFLERETTPDVPRGFAHFIFEITNPGFNVAKEVLAAIQSRRRPQLSLAQYGGGMASMCAFGFERFVRSRLYIPPQTPVHLQLDLEQQASPGNHVSLDSSRDEYGRPAARIRWQVQSADLQSIRSAAERILAKWPTSFPSPFRLKPTFVDGNEPKPHDAYHPVGTCRLGADRRAVVDRELKVAGTENLRVVSTAVLPTAGTANPTFTMLCLAEDLLRHFPT